nr:immunoglobulin light chain junction region [Macaca mulatta]
DYYCQSYDNSLIAYIF